MRTAVCGSLLARCGGVCAAAGQTETIVCGVSVTHIDLHDGDVVRKSAAREVNATQVSPNLPTSLRVAWRTSALARHCPTPARCILALSCA